MNKRGLQYVDWAVSAGLFLIYLVVLFILLGPAFSADYSPEYLGGIIKDGVKNELSTEILRFPAFLKLEWSGTPPNPNTNFIFELNNLPDEFNSIDGHQFTIFTPNGNEITQKEATSDSIKFVSNLNYLGIAGSGDSTTLEIYLADHNAFGDTPASGTNFPEDEFSTIGVAESIKGINKTEFNDFFDDSTYDYKTIKENLNYPLNKDFILEIYEGTSLAQSDILLNYTQVFPSEKDTVNTLVWSDWLIEIQNGQTPEETRKLVTVLVKVW